MATPNNTSEIKRLKPFYGGNLLAIRLLALGNIVLIAALAMVTYTLHDVRSQITNWKPVVIRVNKAGTAVPIDLTTISDPAQEIEVKAFSAQYVEWIQSYDGHNMNRDFARAFACTLKETSQQLANYFRADPTLKEIQRTGAYVNCHIDAVQVLKQSPWEVQVTYTLKNTGSGDTTKWYALLTLKDHARSFRNPFGLLVTGVRINNAF